MFFHDLIRRRLASLLRPWLLEEPNLDLKLGLINSHVTARNLACDASVLNRLLLDDSSSRFIFEQVTVEHLEIRFSNWSVPAFDVEIRGVSVTLSAKGLKEKEQEQKLRRRKSSEAVDDEERRRKKKALAELDPEGSALHDVLERMLVATPSRSQLTISLLNVFLQHWRLQILDVRLQVQSLQLDDAPFWFFELKELSAESQFVEHGCLLRGAVGAVFLPVKESSFLVDFGGFKIGYKMKDQMDRVLSSTDLCTCVKLKDLQLGDLSIRVPELDLKFSPLDLPVILAFSALFSEQSKNVRNGRQLWRLAAIRLGNIISSPRLLLHNVVEFVHLWLHYLNAYKGLLSLLGHSSGHLLKRSEAKMIKDRMLVGSMEYNWKVISGIEKELPYEALAQARRIARYKAALSFQCGDDSHVETSSMQYTFLSRFLSVLVAIGNLMCRVFLSIVQCFLAVKCFFRTSKINRHPVVASEDHSPQFCFLLNFGKVVISLSPAKTVEDVSEKIELQTGFMYEHIHWFCLTIEAFRVASIDGNFEQSLSITCGHLKVRSCLIEARISESSLNNRSSYTSGLCRRKANNSVKVLWSEPARMLPSPQVSETSDAGQGEGPGSPYLKKLLREMWLTWKRATAQYDNTEIEYSENPWLLCETKSCLTYFSQHNSESGLWQFCLAVGKLNSVLTYSSIVSMAILLGQMQHALDSSEVNDVAISLSDAPPPMEGQVTLSSNAGYEFLVDSMKRFLLTMMPEKRIQIGLFVTGPQIQISLKEDGFAGQTGKVNPVTNEGHTQIGFGMQNVEVVILPTSKSDLKLPGWPGFVDAECPSLGEPQIIEIPKIDNEMYTSRKCVSLLSYIRVSGLSIYLGDRPRSQIFVLKPITVQLSSFRESVHSFGSTLIALSATVCGLAAGFNLMLCMDESYAFFQVVAGLCSVASNAFGVGLVGFEPFLDFMGQSMVLMKSKYDGQDQKAEGSLLIHNHCLLSTTATFKCKSMDIILLHSRTCEKVESSSIQYNASSGQKVAGNEWSDHGIWIYLHQASVEISCEEANLGVLLDLLKLQSVMFGHRDHVRESFDPFVLRDLLQQSDDWLCEISLSSCKLTLCFGQNQNSSLVNSSGISALGDRASCRLENSQLSSHAEFCQFSQNFGFASDIILPSSNRWILINVAMGQILIASRSAKNFLLGARELSNLTSLVSIGGNFQTISWALQGGLLCLETTALWMFLPCFASYLYCIKNLSSIMRECLKPARSSEYEEQETVCATEKPKWELPEVCTIDMSKFSLAFVVKDDSGGFQELVLEVDARVRLELANLTRKFMLDLSRMSFLSKLLQQCKENRDQTPHFSSVTRNESLSHILPQVPDVAVQESLIGCQNHILRHLVAFISIKKLDSAPLHLNDGWAGQGSISGFDVTISLSEIKMILFIISSFSAPSIGETSADLRGDRWSTNQDNASRFEDIVPDGAIVAIQDVHQHMYFAVEGEEYKYNLSGVIHHSLVGEKALFRVKHHWQRTWKSSVLWFSLTSLHAKNNSGELLQLKYGPGSGFVDISSSKDSRWSLWRALSRAPENDKGDIDWELSSKIVKDTFYLVNQKNDCAVAFVDRIPEFVKKPGNPFKFKVFHFNALAHGVARSDGYPLASSGANHSSKCEDVGSQQHGSLPCICVRVDNVSLTIVHELLDTKDRFPLLLCAINISQLIVQVLSHKTRAITTASVMLYHFDARQYIWRELLHPVELRIFYRANLQIQGSEIAHHGVPVHIHIRIEEFLISLTELSLDILLFVIGKLDLAGPFAVKSSWILANCCKVENQSGLNLLCHFFNQKSVTIAREQSASVFLRHQMFENQTAESASTVAIQLSNFGSLATSSLCFSVLKSQALAWRTRIISVQDSRTYPGPIVVVDVSRKSEDGVFIAVTPLIRIHNETEFSLELRFRRPQQSEDAHASVLLKTGDSIDDSVATFDAISLSGGVKKALMSLTVGNFFLSFRPEINDSLINLGRELSVEWSDELKGGKAIQPSGIFDKLGYKVRQALSVESVKCSFSTACCAIKSGDARVLNLHFLIKSVSREVPISPPDGSGNASEIRSSTVALQEQKEIFLLPTVRVSNFLHSDISVLLSETDPRATVSSCTIGKQATISHGSTVDYYANPGIIYFTVTLIASTTSCKPVNSGDWMKKFKSKNDALCLDVELDFGGLIFASLRLSRGFQGVLEAAIFTPYSVKNDSDVSLYVFGLNQKPFSRDEVRKFGPSIPLELGLVLPPNSIRSWFSKSHKMRLKILEDNSSETLLDLGALSGLTEISLETEGRPGIIYIRKLGVSIGPFSNKVALPSQMVTMVPRHVIFNESEESITVCQFDFEDEMAGMISVNSKQRATLKLRHPISKSREFNLFESIIRKHRNDTGTKSAYIRFRLNEPNSEWSGPVCSASLGRFFLKFRKRSHLQALDDNVMEFAVVHVVEEGSTLGVHFQKPPNINLPYLIENRLHDTSFTYYQKDSSEREVLGSTCNAYYVWDDLTLPHKLVVVIEDLHLLREINLDKVRPWKPFLKATQRGGLASYSLTDRKSRGQKTVGKANSMEIGKVGYEVYAEGPTRVLRICEFSASPKGERLFQSCAKIQLKIHHVAIHMLEQGKQDLDENEEPSYAPILAARLGNINLDSVFTDQQRYSVMCVQSINVDEKWPGAPFASMLRRHHSDMSDSNSVILKVVVVLLSSSSNVRQVKYSSIVLQPVDLNLDEETLMRMASFWRTSLSCSSTPSQQYYFDHFEIHPIKIVANFLPGDSYSSYNSAQETLRSLLHSIVKIPPLKNMVVELNGVLVTHALITMRDLFVRCAQHYSWYAMRSIYIAKGSPLLPPAFASIFDDLSSSSLDVFFDPSSGLINLSGATLGTFKFISKCIDGKGFSGTRRYFGDLGKTLRTVGSNVLFAAVTEISDSILTGAETNGFDGMISGFHQGILKLAMEPSLLGTALMGGGPNRKIKLDRSPGVDELYIEGYLQAMLDCMYRQEYLRVRVVDDEVLLKNLPPNSALTAEIMDRVKEFLASKALLKGDPASSSSLCHLHAEREWKIGPTVITLFEHLFVSFAIRTLRKQTSRFLANLKVKKHADGGDHEPEGEEDSRAVVPADTTKQEEHKAKFVWKWGIGKFVLSGILAYIDGRLCRSIPNPVARRIVSGYLLSFLDRSDREN